MAYSSWAVLVMEGDKVWINGARYKKPDPRILAAVEKAVPAPRPHIIRGLLRLEKKQYTFTLDKEG